VAVPVPVPAEPVAVPETADPPKGTQVPA